MIFSTHPSVKAQIPPYFIRPLWGIWLVILWLCSAVGAQNALQPEVVVQTGHSNRVNVMAWSSNGALLATGGADERVLLWDIRSGRQLREIEHSGPVTALSFSPDATTLAVGGGDVEKKDGGVRLWNVATGKLVRTFVGLRLPIAHLRFASDGATLGGTSGRLWDADSDKPGSDAIVVWDVNTGHMNAQIAAFDGGGDVFFEPDGTLLSAGEQGVRHWDATLTKVAHWVAPPSNVLSANGQYAAAFARNKVWVWSLENATYEPFSPLPKPLRMWTLPFEPKKLEFSPDSRTLLALGQYKFDDPVGKTQSAPSAVWPLDLPEGAVPLLQNDTVAGAVDAKGTLLALGSASGGVTLQDLTSKKTLHPLGARLKAANALTLLDEDTLAIAQDNGVRRWNLRTARLEAGTIRPFSDDDFEKDLNFLEASPDGTRLAVAGQHNIFILDAQKGTILHRLSQKNNSQLTSHNGWICSLRWNPRGTLLASCDFGGVVCLWDGQTGQYLREFKSSPLTAEAVAWSHDGSMLASAGGHADPLTFFGKTEPVDLDVHLWNPETGKAIRALHGHGATIAALCWDPKTFKLASCDTQGTVIIWDAQTGKALQRISDALPEQHGSLSSLALAWGAGETLAVGGLSGDIGLWDAATGKKLHTLNGHRRLRDLRFASNGRTLFSLGSEGTVRVWDASTGQEHATLIAGANGGIALEPHSFYAADKAALDTVAFRLNGRAYPFEQFDLQLNRPDKVLASLGAVMPGGASKELVAAYESAYRKRVARLGLSEAQLRPDFHLPELQVTTTDLPVSTPQASLQFQVHASDSQAPLAVLRVLVNGVPVPDSRGTPIADNRREAELPLQLALTPGNNTVSVSAINAQGAESLAQTFNVTCEVPATKPQLWVVGVGVSKFKDGQWNLTYPAKDVHDLLDFLSHHSANFAQVHALPVLDENATLANILKIHEFLMQSQPGDEVVLFFSGHGLLDDKQDYYFGTTDIDFAHPEGRGLGYDALQGLLDGIPARRRLLMMDTCHAGEIERDPKAQPAAKAQTAPPQIARGVKVIPVQGARGIVRENTAPEGTLADDGALLEEQFADLRRDGATVMAAAGGEQFAYEDAKWNNGVFTYCVLQGLNGAADSNGDKQISVSELRDYVGKRVPELTNGLQRPVARRENPVEDFLLY